jgi:quercetin dioxygenase-like cupin family protein
MPTDARSAAADTTPGFAFHTDLAQLVGAIQPDSIISRSVHNDDRIKVTLFGFAAGQELTEHTASKPAIIQVLAGEGTYGLGHEVVTVGPGSWAYMEPNLPHTVTARTPLVMLLTMLKEPRLP